MGEVWRARDTRLGRDVAIKALPAAFAQDAERLARFEREAQVLAALNHPNIAAVYGLEEADGASCLVLEFVPGDTLRGPVAVEDALTIARQLIDALEEAHEKGIVHRDLKPANIKMTPEGKVKVLDFGLAKALAGDLAAEVSTNSPTLTLAALTRGGVLLGTAAYMSPEQARGKAVDKRTDIWAFGAVLYEILTGRQVFGGETVTDSLAAIMKNEPDWSALPDSAPPQVRRLLARCLEKDPKRRLRDIGEARILLDEPAPLPTPITQHRSPIIPWAALAVVSVVAAVALWGWLRAPKPTLRPVTRLATTLPQRASPRADVTISRDGTRLAYVGGPSRQIYVRLLDQIEAKPLAGTEGALLPSFSPDGQWLLFQQTSLKKIQVVGGAAITLCDLGTGFWGASWGTDGSIIFGTGTTGLSRVSDAGGKPEVLTTPDAKKREINHRWPHLLPGGEAVLFTIGAAGQTSFDGAKIAALHLKTREQRVLVEGAAQARYVPGAAPGGRGYLVYWRAGSLFAAPFDSRRLQLTGSPVPILEGVKGLPANGIVEFSFSDTGTLVYAPGAPDDADRSLVWVDRKGQVQPLPAPPRQYSYVRLSPDGQRAALAIGPAEQSDIWMYDVVRGTLTRLTFQGENGSPAWTPDGKRVTFRSVQTDKATISSAPFDGSRPAEALAAVDDFPREQSWSPDGKVLALALSRSAGTRPDIWLLPREERKPRLWQQAPDGTYHPQFSPDGRWLAYTRGPLPRAQVCVEPAPGARSGGGGRWQVSVDGGRLPLWARSGRELFFRNGDKVMAVDVESGPAFRAGTPKLLFEGQYATTSWDAAPDGKRFLMIKSRAVETTPDQVHVVMEWFEEIRRRVPAGSR